MADTAHQHQHPLPPTSTDARTVYLETFGCQMNVLDSQLVRQQLLALGYTFVPNWKDAQVILYNTCSVREQAENKVYSRVGEVRQHKKNQPGVVLGILGCMAERDGRDMIRRYPQIDLLCGPGELDKVPLLIDNAVKTSLYERRSWRGSHVALQGNTHRRSATLAAAEDELELLDLSRSFSPDEHQGSAYVRITRGCNKFCTYCVVPFTRGTEIHRPPDHIVDECRQLVDSGVVEITLLGQTVNHYRYDHGAAVTIRGVQQPQVGATFKTDRSTRSHGVDSRMTSFADLLARIHEQVPGLKRLRFVTSYPRDFGNDVLQAMADHPRICRYLHLPAQSGSNRILALMNRGYEVQQYTDLLDRARAYLPDVQIAGDLICGFPTETQDDHQATCELLRRAQYKNCFIFKYSPRPGTAAIQRLKDDVPDEVKRQRNNELLGIQSNISEQIHDGMVGRTVKVFIESISQKSAKRQDAGHGATVTLGWEKPTTQLTGRTDGDLIVMVDGAPSLIGAIVEVNIDQAAPLTLFGHLASASSPPPPRSPALGTESAVTMERVVCKTSQAQLDDTAAAESVS